METKTLGRLIGALNVRSGTSVEDVKRIITAAIRCDDAEAGSVLTLDGDKVSFDIKLHAVKSAPIDLAIAQLARMLPIVVLPGQWLIHEDFSVDDIEKRFKEVFIGYDDFEQHQAKRERACSLLRRVLADDTTAEALAVLQTLIHEAPLAGRAKLGLPSLKSRDYLDDECDDLVAMTIDGERVIGTSESKLGTGRIERWQRSGSQLDLEYNAGEAVDGDNADFFVATNVFGDHLYLTEAGSVVPEHQIVLVAESRLAEFLSDARDGLIK